jgi:hypothetical protein
MQPAVGHERDEVKWPRKVDQLEIRKDEKADLMRHGDDPRGLTMED